jgi:DNA-directed RNA polymerase subunit alpha
MTKLTCIENFIDKEENQYGCFLIEPLEIGQGITLGNSLRRTLLSDLTSYAITGVRINDLTHEFSVIEGLREDVLEVLFNLKEIIFKPSFYSKQKEKKFKAFLNVQGPIIVTAGMFMLPRDLAIILNPRHYICTITDSSQLYLELDIELGKGYKLLHEKAIENIPENNTIGLRASTLLLDSIFMPVKRVNYKIKLIHDTQGNIKESLYLEIWTNGSLSPKRAVQEALKNLLNLYYNLFATPEFLTISSQYANKFFTKLEQ